MTPDSQTDELNYGPDGLIPVIVQDSRTLQVLTLAWMNAESFQKTLATGETWFWSRRRQRLWHKGETSGNTQRVVAMRYDCDADALLVLVERRGPACHTGQESCFFRSIGGGWLDGGNPGLEADESIFGRLYDLLLERKANPRPDSYTARLLANGLPRIARKVGEEAAEVMVAALAEDEARLVEEAADLLYHVFVLLIGRGLPLAALTGELKKRNRSGK